MIFVVIAALVGVVAFVMLWRELWTRNRPRKMSKVAATATVALLAALVVLTGTGRLHWGAALVAGVLPFLRWVLGLLVGPMLSYFLRSKVFGRAGPAHDPGPSPAGPRTSTVATDDLRMTLDHQTGDMDGEVLSGRLAGQRLGGLDRQTLTSLYGELAATDSRQLLGAYLDRRFPDWSDTGTRRETPTPAGDMDREQALAVLGLEDGATEQEIVDAHRRLMQRLHPDRGGTDYLAATLNLAKQTLLDH